ncbi:hypothetical protein [Thauera butanivorans]|uniref:hypothetical protein n=1 Tax=Thauera butanivorans TaxID=86174 RepID=UPI0008391B91|nr:hypothetical protein [Thauera butanivorans]
MSLDRNAPYNQLLGRIVRFGDTAHGLYRESTGKIETPSGVEIACPGVRPVAGDSFVVRVPGMPSIDRSADEVAADAAAGREWINYGIIAGINHRLYGVPLDTVQREGGWIYVADDGSRWLCRLVFLVNGDLRLTFREFGVVRDAATPSPVTQTVVIPPAQHGFGVHAQSYIQRVIFGATLTDTSSAVVIDAIASRGQRVALRGLSLLFEGGLPRLNNAQAFMPLYTNSSGPAVNNIAEISISGVPPAAVCVTTLKLPPLFVGSDERLVSDVRHYIGVIKYLGEVSGFSSAEVVSGTFEFDGRTAEALFRELHPPIDHVRDSELLLTAAVDGEGELSVRRLAGCYYDDDDLLQLATLDVTIAVSTTVALDADVEVAEGALVKKDAWCNVNTEMVATARMNFAPDVVWSSTANMVTVEGPTGRQVEIAWSGDGGSWTGSVASSTKIFTSRSHSRINSTHASRYTSDGVPIGVLQWSGGGVDSCMIEMSGSGNTPDDQRVSFDVIRLSNRTWGVRALGGIGAETYDRIISLISPGDHVRFSPTAPPAVADLCASAHPVTGEIAYSLDGYVCWV